MNSMPNGYWNGVSYSEVDAEGPQPSASSLKGRNAPVRRLAVRMSGSIHAFHAPSGIGKIAAEEGPRVNFHINDVLNASIVRKGQRVRFERQVDQRPGRNGRLEARRITVQAAEENSEALSDDTR